LKGWRFELKEFARTLNKQWLGLHHHCAKKDVSTILLHVHFITLCNKLDTSGLVFRYKLGPHVVFTRLPLKHSGQSEIEVPLFK
jgi:hypothetical protein